MSCADELRRLSDAAADGPWFVAKARRSDGLAEIEDGQQEGLFPIVGEWPEIEFIVALVNAYRSGALVLSNPEAPHVG